MQQAGTKVMQSFSEAWEGEGAMSIKTQPLNGVQGSRGSFKKSADIFTHLPNSPLLASEADSGTP